jgi:hypothetical protein
MLMPKASVDKYHFPARDKNEIGCSRQIPAVQAESVTEPMQQAAHNELRICVLAPDLAHDPTALLRTELICHFLAAKSRCSLTALRSCDRTVAESALNSGCFAIL